MPDGAAFVGRYDLDIGGFSATEGLFLAGGAGSWELWSVQTGWRGNLEQILEKREARDPNWRTGVLAAGLAVAGTLRGDPGEAAGALLAVLLRARIHDGRICGPFGAGLLPAETISAAVADLEAELERKWQQAVAAELARPSPIIEAAKAWGLEPKPAGHDPHAWTANCPSGRNHWIMISTTANEFGCGYCRRKGGPDELRRFCAENRKPGAGNDPSCLGIL